MLQTTYETNRLLLLQSNPRLKKQVLEYYKENQSFLQATEPKRPTDFFTLTTQKMLLKRDWKNFENRMNVRFWLTLKENRNRIIGVVAINNILLGPVQTGIIAYKCHKDEINKGYITEALKKLVKIAFDDLGLHRLEANIMPRNHRSLRVAQKLGFQNEGVARECVQINGEWEDHVRMALIKTDLF